MAKLNTIVKFLNKELKINKIKDHSRNGLQVRGAGEVRKIAFGVDACMELFERAKANNCDLIIVHHGLLWKPQKKTATLQKRMAYLRKNRMSLYAAHAPLDVHGKYGNNAQLAEIMGAKVLKPFGKADGINWGFSGTIKPMTVKMIAEKINKKLKTKCIILGFGKEKITRIGIVSGGGYFAIAEAAKKADLLLTGEIKHSNYHTAKELKTNVISGGHYATETLGVKALMGLLKEKFKIETVFIDVPTGM